MCLRTHRLCSLTRLNSAPTITLSHIARASTVEGAADALATLVQHVRVDHRRTHVVVAKQLLHGADVVARLQQVRRETVPETVAGRALGKFGPANRRRHLLRERGLVGMMPANNTGTRVSRYSRGRAKKLPAKFRRSVWEFSFERGRQKHAATATFPPS